MRRSQQIVLVVIGLLTVLVVASSAVFSKASGMGFPLLGGTGTPGADSILDKIFLPFLNREPASFDISGQVRDESNQPVGGVKIVDQSGQTVFTDANGNYAFHSLAPGDYDLAPAKSGLVFSPAMSSVNLPGEGNPVDFTAITACTEALKNTSFENDNYWVFPATPKPADYSTAIVHSGSRAVRTGIVRTLDNTFSYSSARSPVIKVPSDIGSATLRVWLYPISEEGSATTLLDAPRGPEFGEAVFSHDAQYVLVLDPGSDPESVNDDTLLETLLWIRSDSQTWMLHEFDLTKYAGDTIKLQFGTFNDGANGVSALYVDDASLEFCDAPQVTPTATPTPTGIPASCQNRLGNPGFEVNGSWDIPLTVFPAAYTTERANTGTRSMRTGIVKSTSNVFSYSDAGQWVTIPSGTAVATLRMWIFPVSTGVTSLAELALPPAPEAGTSLNDFQQISLSDDVQYVLILDQFSNIEETLLWQRSNSQTWGVKEFDLTKYKGRTIKVQFGTFNNGFGGVTSMYVDDTTVVTCTTTTPTPTPTTTPTPTNTPIFTPTPTNTPPAGTTPTATATPTNCSERILNGSFETTSDWVIPITEFSAGYDDNRAHTGSRSMRTGILHTAHNRFSYSDFRQTVSIPWDAKSALVRFWLFPLSEDAAVLQVPAVPLDDIFGKEAIGGDVQYVLILNAYGNWIDTLVWQRSNEGAWTFESLNLDAYIGSTIKLQFGTYNDGLGGVSSMHVDDVSLQVCK